MKCPVCTTVDLVMSERSGIEIDYCPQCRGVWLDRGELDKIIERNETSSTPKSDFSREFRGDDDRKYRDDDRRYRDDDDYKHRHKKKGGLLGDLFDF